MPQIDRLEIWNAHLFEKVFPIEGEVCIVGNGPVIPSDRQMIDQADVVIRQNNWGSRSCLKDSALPVIGGRCDVMIGNWDIHTTCMGRDGVDHPRVAVMAIPYPHRMGDSDVLSERFYPPETTPYLAAAHPFWVRDCCNALGLPSDGTKHPMPTVGMTAIYSMWRMLEHLPYVEQVSICGYSWHVGDDIPKKAAPSTHCYPREALWCSLHILRDPLWRFSEIAQEALEKMEMWYAQEALPWAHEVIG